MTGRERELLKNARDLAEGVKVDAELVIADPTRQTESISKQQIDAAERFLKQLDDYNDYVKV